MKAAHANIPYGDSSDRDVVPCTIKEDGHISLFLDPSFFILSARPCRFPRGALKDAGQEERALRRRIRFGSFHDNKNVNAFTAVFFFVFFFFFEGEQGVTPELKGRVGEMRRKRGKLID